MQIDMQLWKWTSFKILQFEQTRLKKMGPHSSGRNITWALSGSHNCVKKTWLSTLSDITILWSHSLYCTVNKHLLNGSSAESERGGRQMKNGEADSESDEMGGDHLPSTNTELGLITLHVFWRLNNARCSAQLLLLKPTKQSAPLGFCAVVARWIMTSRIVTISCQSLKSTVLSRRRLKWV